VVILRGNIGRTCIPVLNPGEACVEHLRISICLKSAPGYPILRSAVIEECATKPGGHTDFRSKGDLHPLGCYRSSVISRSPVLQSTGSTRRDVLAPVPPLVELPLGPHAWVCSVPCNLFGCHEGADPLKCLGRYVCSRERFCIAMCLSKLSLVSPHNAFYPYEVLRRLTLGE
jgi:hypothetical protein